MSTAIATAESGGHGAHVLPPDAHFGNASAGKVGMWIFLLSDAFSFGGLLLAYGILRGGAQVWRHEGQPSFGINFTAALTFLLICSSVTMVFAVAAAQEGNRKQTVRMLALTAVGGALFLCGQMQEYFGAFSFLGLDHGLIHEGLKFGSSGYANTFFVTTSFHGMHVLTGVIYITTMLIHTARGKTDANDIEVLGLFWHFVDLVWILVFTFIYLL
ncbi:MAG: cytochrome c oxidase subunit 3 [Myxococcaceae bacterium]